MTKTMQEWQRWMAALFARQYTEPDLREVISGDIRRIHQAINMQPAGKAIVISGLEIEE